MTARWTPGELVDLDGSLPKARIDGLPNDATAILLTGEIAAVVGHETAIYFDNILNSYGPTPIYNVDVASTYGMLLEDKWTYTPVAGDVGTHAGGVTITVTYYDLTTATKTLDLVVKPAVCASTVTRQILTIGDSTTDADSAPNANGGKWLGEILNLCNYNHTSPTTGGGADNLTITLNGHRTQTAQGRDAVTRTVKTSAIGGMSIAAFTTSSSSPFVFGGVFSVPQYCTANSITLAADDWVIFAVGINDVVFSTSDADCQENIATALDCYEQFFAGFKAVQSAVRFGVMLPIPPAASQDAFGISYGCLYKRSNQKRWIGMLTAAMITALGGRESENIFVGATYHANLDTVRNFPWVGRAINSGNPTQMARMSNALHPGSQGQFQMADSVYAFLRRHES